MTLMDEYLLPYRGDKLRLIRLAKGLSLEEVGQAVNVTKQYVHKLEAGQEPSDDQVSLLCDLFGVEERYFYAERNTPVVEEQCHFRSLRSRTKTLTNSVMAKAELLDALVAKLEPNYSLDKFEAPDVSGFDLENTNHIERIAELVREEWDLGEGPIADMTVVVERAGVIVAEIEGVDEKVDAFSMSRQRPIVIRNNAKNNPCRYRFDLAHELGHLVMHEGQDTGCKATEKQANSFASAFLMPRKVFQLAVEKFRLIKGQKHLNWGSLEALKRYFKVSFKALLYRASTLGLITEEQMRTGFIALNRSGQSKSENLDDEIPMESPGLLSDLVGGITTSRFKEILRELGLTYDVVGTLYPGLKLPRSHLHSV